MKDFDKPMPNESQTAYRARQRRDTAERSRAYRERLKTEGVPTARETDEAIVEALSFVMRYAVFVDGDAFINVRDVYLASILILKREGKRRIHAEVIIKDRLTPRHVHTQRGWMPSTNPSSAKMTHDPKPGAKPWNDRDIFDLRNIIRRFAGK